MQEKYRIDEDINNIKVNLSIMMMRMQDLGNIHNGIVGKLDSELWQGKTCDTAKIIHDGIAVYKKEIEDAIISLNENIISLEQLAYEFVDYSTKVEVIEKI